VTPDVEVTEDEFMPTVRSWLQERFPKADVWEEFYLDSGRFVDFLIVGSGWMLAVFDDRAEDVQEGVAQARVYAASRPEAAGMVVYPSSTGSVREDVQSAFPAIGVVAVDPRGESGVSAGG
jgi:hypothetical protein